MPRDTKALWAVILGGIVGILVVPHWGIWSYPIGCIAGCLVGYGVRAATLYDFRSNPKQPKELSFEEKVERAGDIAGVSWVLLVLFGFTAFEIWKLHATVKGDNAGEIALGGLVCVFFWTMLMLTETIPNRPAVMPQDSREHAIKILEEGGIARLVLTYFRGMAQNHLVSLIPMVLAILALVGNVILSPVIALAAVVCGMAWSVKQARFWSAVAVTIVVTGITLFFTRGWVEDGRYVWLVAFGNGGACAAAWWRLQARLDGLAERVRVKSLSIAKGAITGPWKVMMAPWQKGCGRLVWSL